MSGLSYVTLASKMSCVCLGYSLLGVLPNWKFQYGRAVIVKKNMSIRLIDISFSISIISIRYIDICP